MKLKHAKHQNGIHSLSVGGETHVVDEKTGIVNLPNSTPAKTVKHLLSQGWQIADSAAEQKSKEDDSKDKGGKDKGGK